MQAFALFLCHVAMMLADVVRGLVFVLIIYPLKGVARALWLAAFAPWTELRVFWWHVVNGQSESLLERYRALLASDVDSWRTNPPEDPAETERRSRLLHPELWLGRD